MHNLQKACLLGTFTASSGPYKTCSDCPRNLTSHFQGNMADVGWRHPNTGSCVLCGHIFPPAPRPGAARLPAWDGSSGMWRGWQMEGPKVGPPWGHLREGGDRQHAHSRARTVAYGPGDLPPRLTGNLSGPGAEEESCSFLYRSSSFD